jgi:nicotinamidase-related amidase
VLVLIDHQPYQLANLNSHDPQAVVNNTTALAKVAKVFGVPTILTSVVADRGGDIFPHVTEVFPDQEVIDRTFINTWEDPKVVDAVKATGRKQLIIAGLWTEICVAMPAIQAAGEGWDVTVITDASGGTSLEAHEVAIQRMIAGRRQHDDLAGAGVRMAARLGPGRPRPTCDSPLNDALSSSSTPASLRRSAIASVSVGAAAAQHAGLRPSAWPSF